jgi:hypothetical protein
MLARIGIGNLRILLCTAELITLNRFERLLRALPLPVVIAHQFSPLVVVFLGAIQVYLEIERATSAQPLAAIVRYNAVVQFLLGRSFIFVVKIRTQSKPRIAEKRRPELVAFSIRASLNQQN